jgi:hypothetical protein
MSLLQLLAYLVVPKASVYRIETHHKRQLRKYNIRSEWFHITPETLKHICSFTWLNTHLYNSLLEAVQVSG